MVLFGIWFVTGFCLLGGVHLATGGQSLFAGGLAWAIVAYMVGWAWRWMEDYPEFEEIDFDGGIESIIGCGEYLLCGPFWPTTLAKKWLREAKEFLIFFFLMLVLMVGKD